MHETNYCHCCDHVNVYLHAMSIVLMLILIFYTGPLMMGVFRCVVWERGGVAIWDHFGDGVGLMMLIDDDDADDTDDDDGI